MHLDARLSYYFFLVHSFVNAHFFYIVSYRVQCPYSIWLWLGPYHYRMPRASFVIQVCGVFDVGPVPTPSHSRWIEGRIDAWVYKKKASCEIQLSHMYYTRAYTAFTRRCKLKQMPRQRQTEREWVYERDRRFLTCSPLAAKEMDYVKSNAENAQILILHKYTAISWRKYAFMCMYMLNCEVIVCVHEPASVVAFPPSNLSQN